MTFLPPKVGKVLELSDELGERAETLMNLFAEEQENSSMACAMLARVDSNLAKAVRCILAIHITMEHESCAAHLLAELDSQLSPLRTVLGHIKTRNFDDA